MITARLKTQAIDKTKLQKDKNGNVVLDIVLIETPNSKYGDDFMVVQGLTKAEREAGVKGAILGNAKIWNKPADQQQSKPAASQSQGPPNGTGDDDALPF